MREFAHLMNISGKSGDDPEAKKTMFFFDKSMAYDYMWEKSHDDNGNFKVEITAWELLNGILVLPYNLNQFDKSRTDAFKVTRWGRTGGRAVIINGIKHKIIGHIHTHPTIESKKNNPIGFSKEDLAFQRAMKFPIKIVFNKRIYSFDGTYNQKSKMWNYEDLGTW